ncbi:MAG: hypothetical protein HF978_04920 [Desulfobacteraceae bacterium]|nr:hypothetical protein [Desulfobacteraceae bacterium]MBC2754872.1 hypothetical protein [Desulfobacteraceae bacterium]
MSHIKEKTCRKCREVKPIDDFYENKYSPDGRYTFCKVCFDQFAKKLKEKKNAPAPLNKTCEKCGKLKPLNAFDTFDDHLEKSDTPKNWCKDCRQQDDDLKKQPAEKEKKPGLQAPKIKKTKPRDLPKKNSKAKKPVQEPVKKATPKPVQELADKPAQKQTRKLEQEPASEQKPAQKRSQEPADEFDFIEHLLKTQTLETQALENKLALEKLQIPKQITKIKVRKRICNGCGKTEEIDQVEKNTVIPVHAWFCDFCRQRAAKRLVRKGMTVQDYWGRKFKIKKFISSEIVMGVLKNKTGKWEKRPLKIYGSWKTP